MKMEMIVELKLSINLKSNTSSSNNHDKDFLGTQRMIQQ